MPRRFVVGAMKTKFGLVSIALLSTIASGCGCGAEQPTAKDASSATFDAGAIDASAGDAMGRDATGQDGVRQDAVNQDSHRDDGAVNDATDSAADQDAARPDATTGIDATQPRCIVAAVPASLSFGMIAGDSGSVDRTILLKNNGECHCRITAISDVVMDAQAPVGPGTFSFPTLPALPLYLAGYAPNSPGCDTFGQTPASDRFLLSVRYALPNRADAFLERGHFTVDSNDPITSPLTIALEAEGGGAPRCQFKVTPEAPDEPDPGGFDFSSKATIERWGLVRFGNVNVFFERMQPITFENIGNLDCTINQIVWRQPWTPQNEFGLADENRQPLALPAGVNRTVHPGETATYYATFTPTHLAVDGSPIPMPSMNCLSGGYCGARTGGMTMNETCMYPPCLWGNGVDIVTSDTVTGVSVTGQHAVQGTFSIGFMGKPVTPAIDVIPIKIDFGLITIGCGSEARAIKIYNTGNGVLTITRLEIAPSAGPDEFLVVAPPVPPTQEVQPGGAPLTIDVRFLPRREATHRADLIIYGQEGSNEMPMFTVPLEGTGTLATHQGDVFRQLTDPLVDVLWVIDDSGSMAGEQLLLADNFPGYFSQTANNNIDYHIAVTTTLTRDGCVPDFSNPSDSCAGQPPHEMAGMYTACQGNDKWITFNPQTPNPEQQFACNANTTANRYPDRPTSDEAEGGLMAAKLFLSPPKIDDPVANGGFLRPDARLDIIVISDEEDQSDGPIDLYVDFFRNLKGVWNQGLVKFAAIAGDSPGGCGGGSTGQGIGADPGARYAAVADAMNGVFYSMCTPDWSAMMQSLASDSFDPKIQFSLSRRSASAAAVEVCVSSQDLTGYAGACSGRGGSVVAMTGQGAANGWWRDGITNSVVFNQGSVPQRGQWIRADYDTACLPLQ